MSSPLNSVDEFAAFGLDALFDESNNVETIAARESDESETSDEDDSFDAANFQAAWFQAKEKASD